jgi:hypothetical protein
MHDVIFDFPNRIRLAKYRSVEPAPRQVISAATRTDGCNVTNLSPFNEAQLAVGREDARPGFALMTIREKRNNGIRRMPGTCLKKKPSPISSSPDSTFPKVVALSPSNTCSRSYGLRGGNALMACATPPAAHRGGPPIDRDGPDSRTHLPGRRAGGARGDGTAPNAPDRFRLWCRTVSASLRLTEGACRHSDSRLRPEVSNRRMRAPPNQLAEGSKKLRVRAGRGPPRKHNP